MSYPNKILVIGDAHVSSHQSLRRFNWLEAFIKAKADFTHLVIIGDFLTFSSLSAWDKDKRLTMEGQRLQEEVEAGNEALDIIQPSENEFHEKIFLEGNHENRLPRYLESHPELAGNTMIVPVMLELSKRGYKWVPYRKYYTIGGINFTHIPFGKMREISGKDICSKAELVTVGSTAFGHTHELHTSCVHKHGMTHLQQILNVGCFFEKSEDYVEGKMTNYWKGIVVLNNYDYGRFDIETYSMSRLKALYNGTLN